MSTIEELEERIIRIEERNGRVELGKAWETSFTRKLFISLFTYLAIAIYMYAIGMSNPWLNAIIPTVGFLLSTLTLSFVRKFWEKYFNRN
ncbi:MAG: hypothetical protein AAB481_03780 [Patescibacteria group bacterium]